jgi:methionine aminotransferase
VHHPSQKALASYLENDAHYLGLNAFFQKKRDLFLDLIKGSRFKATPAAGTYFQMLDFSQITDQADTLFAERLTKEHGLASIPTSVFNLDKKDFKMLRFCFAKDDEVLKKAAQILRSL